MLLRPQLQSSQPSLLRRKRNLHVYLVSSFHQQGETLRKGLTRKDRKLQFQLCFLAWLAGTQTQLEQPAFLDFRQRSVFTRRRHSQPFCLISFPSFLLHLQLLTCNPKGKNTNFSLQIEEDLCLALCARFRQINLSLRSFLYQTRLVSRYSQLERVELTF